MRLKKLSARNYRTLQNIILHFAPDYCTLSGKNNAGKSCVIRLLNHLMEPHSRSWRQEDHPIDYHEDRTQWGKDNDSIAVEWTLTLFASDDPALIAYIETFSDQNFSESEVEVSVRVTVEANTTQTSISVDGIDLEDRASREILRKLRSSNCLFLHNSTDQQTPIFFGGSGRRQSFYELNLSEEEQKSLNDAVKNVQRKTRQLVKGHRDLLSGLLGKLNEKYDVEFTSLEGYRSKEMPFGINLKDKRVEVPIDDWGSGTQNRTYILMSLLEAKRIKDRQGSEEKITPIVVVEEPESFLHPAAQAEFGGLLQELAQELGIQIIVATHSPFMLNRVQPSSNILLRRQSRRNQLQQTEIVDSSGENWMEPFSEHLGIVAPEFKTWRSLLSSLDSRVLLVEGDIDKEYFSHIRELLGERFGLPEDVEIVPYGGKDALKNTVLVGFVLKSFDRAFVTFDLDATRDVTRSLENLGLQNKQDYLSIGRNNGGRNSIEGLLPNRITAEVFGRETELVLQLASQKAEDRKSAKGRLKRKLLEAFRKGTDYSDDELKEFIEIGKVLKKAFA